MRKIAVIGGGASGMTASISALASGAAVDLFEKNERIGKKLLITGNGRCNLTNIKFNPDNYFGDDPGFVEIAIKNFGIKQTMEFFHKLGLEYYIDESGRVFPASRQASSVLDVMRLELGLLKCNFHILTSVKSIEHNRGKFTIKSEEEFPGYDAVIISAGGRAAPETGSDGSGYALAEKLGHGYRKPFPSLVQLKLDGTAFKQMDGVKWEASVTLYSGNSAIDHSRGDIIFTDYGISGIAILAISRAAVLELLNGKSPWINIDFIDDIDEAHTIALIKERVNNHPGRSLQDFFTGWLNKRIGQAVIKSVGLNLGSTAGEIGDDGIIKICRAIHNYKFGISGHTGWKNAQVTAGGINTDEIDPLTMESRLVKGLYFAGEIIDIDGRSGGYNLQWAWSSGFIAGKSASQALPLK